MTTIIKAAVLKQWAKSFHISDHEDLAQEIHLLDLAYAAGTFKPSFDWTNTEANLGAIYLTLKYRLTENTISLGFDFAGDWKEPSEYLDQNDHAEYDTHGLASAVQNWRATHNVGNEEPSYNPDDEFLYDSPFDSAAYERISFELNVVDRADLSTGAAVLGLGKRAFNELKVKLKGDILKRAALERGFTEEQFNALKEQFMPSNKSVEVETEEAVEA